MLEGDGGVTAAADLAPPVPGLTLHSGAMLFALFDSECAKLMVDIIKGAPVCLGRCSDGLDASEGPTVRRPTNVSG